MYWFEPILSIPISIVCFLVIFIWYRIKDTDTGVKVKAYLDNVNQWIGHTFMFLFFGLWGKL